MAQSRVFLNGQLLDGNTAALPLFDSGVVLGATVSEFTRTFRQQLYRLEEHLDRLFASLRYCRLDPGYSAAELAAIARQLVEQHAAETSPKTELGVIHFVTAGDYPTLAGMAGRPARRTPTVCVHTFPLPLARWARKMREGIRLITPSVRALPAECVDPRIKCRSRMHWFLADREVQAVDPDASALLLDLHGYITETSTANVLFVEQGSIVSPKTTRILPGISRGVVRELAATLGIPFQERDLTLADLPNAQEAFLSSTPFCLMPVANINGAAVGEGRGGAIYHQLLAAWSERVGVDIAGQMLDAAGDETPREPSR